MKHDKVLTINVKTWAVTNAHNHRQHIVDTPFGRMNQTPGYIRGWCGYNPRQVPCCIVRVQNTGFADGLFEFWPSGAIKWGVFDFPLCDGTFVMPYETDYKYL